MRLLLILYEKITTRVIYYSNSMEAHLDHQVKDLLDLQVTPVVHPETHEVLHLVQNGIDLLVSRD